ncbi:antirestriction protein [Salmonella enterica subsp. enterica serovar Newport]|uniref:Antirestriction protein n=1 Tax=Salmonella newport TaxID=108619 RepID=A0A636IKH4_SALNE|nr:antirestriction protein [Salmonella enterica subsp. enterica serovar Newport]
MHTINVKTSTRESDEQFKKDKFQRYCVIDDNERLDFIPALFFNMIASWLRQYSDYDGGFWSYWIIPQGVGGNVAPNKIIFTTTQIGYIAPAGEQRYNMCIPGNYFESEVSADAAGIISTLMIMNWLSWQAADMGAEYAKVCKYLVTRQDALKDYVSLIQHPERNLIWRAID